MRSELGWPGGRQRELLKFPAGADEPVHAEKLRERRPNHMERGVDVPGTGCVTDYAVTVKKNGHFTFTLVTPFHRFFDS